MDDPAVLSIAITIFTLLLSYLTAKVFYWLWIKPKLIERHLRKQGINGTAYKLFYGDIHEFGKSIVRARATSHDLNHSIVYRVLPFIVQTTEKFGDICFYWMFTTPRIIIREPELIREALMNKSGHLERLPLPPYKRLTTGLTALAGDKWAQHRSIVSPAFHQTKLKAMVPDFCASCTEMVNRWHRLIGLDGAFKLDVWIELTAMTSDVISRTAFGSSYVEGKRIFELQEQLIALLLKPEGFPYIPLFRFVWTKDNQRRHQLNKEVNNLLTILIQKKEKAMKHDEKGHEDLLGLMLRSNEQAENNTNDAKLKGMSLQEVMEECKLFYFAGHETTAGLLTWTMILLSMNPSWKTRARNEVMEICGRSPFLNYESINQLKIVNVILLEALRLYPALAAHHRHTYKETKLGNIYLPAGVDLVLPTLMIHHDKNIWGDDAEEFKPERFCEGISKATNNKFSYFPFGWGPRFCVGQNFAMMEAKIAVAMILQNFEFELSSSYAHSPVGSITVKPQHGAPLIIRKLA